MRVLIACEYSGRVTEQFRLAGASAYSCDVLPTLGNPRWHIQDDVLNIIHNYWDLMIAFPPCTHLAVSGARWFNEKEDEQIRALEFVKELWDAPIPFICIENPVSMISTYMRRPHQRLHPYQFGDDASKATYLWLKGLRAIEIPPKRAWIAPRIVTVDGKQVKRWGNQSDKGYHNVPDTPTRGLKKSLTYPGIARAMASNWASLRSGQFSLDTIQPWFTRAQFRSDQLRER